MTTVRLTEYIDLFKEGSGYPYKSLLLRQIQVLVTVPLNY